MLKHGINTLDYRLCLTFEMPRDENLYRTNL